MLIKQARSPDNKQTINLAVNLVQNILHAHYCHCNIISPVLNCLISYFIICKSVSGTAELFSLFSSTWSTISESTAPFKLDNLNRAVSPISAPPPGLLGGKGVKSGKIFTYLMDCWKNVRRRWKSWEKYIFVPSPPISVKSQSPQSSK